MTNIPPVDQFNKLNPNFQVDDIQLKQGEVEIKITQNGKLYKIQSTDVNILNFLKGAGDQTLAADWLSKTSELITALNTDPTNIQKVSWSSSDHGITVVLMDSTQHTYHVNKLTTKEIEDDAKENLDPIKNNIQTNKAALQKVDQELTDLGLIGGMIRSKKKETLSNQKNTLERDITQEESKLKRLQNAKTAGQAAKCVAPLLVTSDFKAATWMAAQEPKVLRTVDLSNLTLEEFNEIPFDDPNFKFNSVIWDSYFTKKPDLTNFPLSKFLSDPDKLSTLIAAGLDVSKLPLDAIQESNLLNLIKGLTLEPQKLTDLLRAAYQKYGDDFILKLDLEGLPSQVVLELIKLAPSKEAEIKQRCLPQGGVPVTQMTKNQLELHLHFSQNPKAILNDVQNSIDLGDPNYLNAKAKANDENIESLKTALNDKDILAKEKQFEQDKARGTYQVKNRNPITSLDDIKTHTDKGNEEWYPILVELCSQTSGNSLFNYKGIIYNPYSLDLGNFTYEYDIQRDPVTNKITGIKVTLNTPCNLQANGENLNLGQPLIQGQGEFTVVKSTGFFSSGFTVEGYKSDFVKTPL